jgi:outer membrane receptor protein involved in Fe transport
VNNLLDKDPPLAPSLSANGFTGTYDPLGRTVYTSLRFDF